MRLQVKWLVLCQSLVNTYLRCSSCSLITSTGSFSILPPVFNTRSNLYIKISIWNFNYVVKLKACALKNSNTSEDQTHSGQTTLKAAALDAVCLCWEWRSSWLVSVSCCASYSRAPTTHSIQRRSPSLFLPLSSLFLFLSFFHSHSLGGSHRADIQRIITRWLKMHHSSQSRSLSLFPCSALRMTYLGVGQSARRVCLCVCVCACVCAAACLYPACWGTNTLWLKLSSLSHLMAPWHMWRRWEQGAEESQGHQAASQKRLAHVSICARVPMCPLRVINSSGVNTNGCLSEFFGAERWRQQFVFTEGTVWVMKNLKERLRDGWICEQTASAAVFWELSLICGFVIASFHLTSYQFGSEKMRGEEIIEQRRRWNLVLRLPGAGGVKFL